MNFLPFLIAKRLHLKKNSICLISTLSKIAISISIFTLIISFSALNGFQESINKTIVSNLPHGIIKIPNNSLLKWQDIIKKLKSFPGITYSEPYIFNDGLLIKNKKIKFVNIKSFNCIKYLTKNFYSLSNHHNFYKKNTNSYQIIISSDLARYLSIKEDDRIDLVVLDKKNNSINSHLEYFSVKINSIFESNGLLDANTVFLPFQFFQNFFNADYNTKTIELYMSNPFKSNEIIINAAKEINSPLLLYTWVNSYKYIYNDIKTIKKIVYFTLLLLIIISCFSIASISLMMISKKTREIAILRSIGANNFLIQLIFLYYGLRFVIVGNLIGLFMSLISILSYKKIIFFLEKYFKSNILSDNIYYNFLSLKLYYLDIIFIFISTIIIGIIINWYPAYYASKINPSKILKEY